MVCSNLGIGEADERGACKQAAGRASPQFSGKGQSASTSREQRGSRWRSEIQTRAGQELDPKRLGQSLLNNNIVTIMNDRDNSAFKHTNFEHLHHHSHVTVNVSNSKMENKNLNNNGRKSSVVNLSSHNVTQPQQSLLEKGLKFCPTPGNQI